MALNLEVQAGSRRTACVHGAPVGSKDPARSQIFSTMGVYVAPGRVHTGVVDKAVIVGIG